MNIENIRYKITKLYRLINLKIENFGLLMFYKNKNNILFEKIIKTNREYLSSFKYFLSKENYHNNDYGIQARIYKELNKPIKEYPTYSDFICFLYLNHFKENFNYLEIGCSVLKNVLQIKNFVSDSNIVSYDINEINPDLKVRYFKKEKNNNVEYFKGDVLKKEDYLNFRNSSSHKYNFIFSDALHEPHAVYSEFENIYKDLLDEKFIIYYDDLDFPGLKKTVEKIKVELSKSYNSLNFYTFKVYGWIGQYENLHLNGILTNLDLEKSLNENDIQIYKLKKIS